MDRSVRTFLLSVFAGALRSRLLATLEPRKIKTSRPRRPSRTNKTRNSSKKAAKDKQQER